MPRKPETIEFMQRIVMHARLDRVHHAIQRAHATSGFEAKGVVIAGPSGVGKSTLIRRYVKNIPKHSTDRCDHLPVLVVEVPPQPDLRSFQMEVLASMGHPRPERRATLGEMRVEVLRYMRKLRVEVMIIDEFQDLLPRRAKASPHVVKLLKNLMNVQRVPCILVGMPETVDLLATGDGQLRRRFNASCYVSPFRIDTEDDFTEFRMYLGHLQSALPVPCTNLAETNNALRLFCASKGIPGLITNLLSEMIEEHTGPQAVLRDLAGAYNAVLGDDEDVPFNPFLEPIQRVKKHVGAA